MSGMKWEKKNRSERFDRNKRQVESATSGPPTARQMGYIVNLFKERDVPEEDLHRYPETLDQARTLIDYLKSLPLKDPKTEEA